MKIVFIIIISWLITHQGLAQTKIISSQPISAAISYAGDNGTIATASGRYSVWKSNLNTGIKNRLL